LTLQFPAIRHHSPRIRSKNKQLLLPHHLEVNLFHPREFADLRVPAETDEAEVGVAGEEVFRAMLAKLLPMVLLHRK
jgi:hypothetical protein